MYIKECVIMQSDPILLHILWVWYKLTQDLAEVLCFTCMIDFCSGTVFCKVSTQFWMGRSCSVVVAAVIVVLVATVVVVVAAVVVVLVATVVVVVAAVVVVVVAAVVVAVAVIVVLIAVVVVVLAAKTVQRKTGHCHNCLWRKCNTQQWCSKWIACKGPSASESVWHLTAKTWSK